MKDEEVMRPDILGKVDDPNVRAELVSFHAPTAYEKRTLRQAHAVAMHFWPLLKVAPVSKEEMVQWSQTRQNLSEEQAKLRVKVALEWYKRRGVEVGI